MTLSELTKDVSVHVTSIQNKCPGMMTCPNITEGWLIQKRFGDKLDIHNGTGKH